MHSRSHSRIGKVKMALGWQMPNIEQRKLHAHLEVAEGESK